MDKKSAVFPVEACALIAVLFTVDVTHAVVGALGLIVMSLLNACTSRIAKASLRNTVRILLGIVYMLCFIAVCTSFFGYGYQSHFAAVAIGLLACLPFLTEDTEAADGSEGSAAFLPPLYDLKEVAYQSAAAGVIMIIAGLIRGFWSTGTLGGIMVCPDAPFVTSFIAEPEIGLITAGIVLAAVCVFCRIYIKTAGTWFVIIPAALYMMTSARGIGGIAKEVFILLIVCVALVSIRKRLVYSETRRPFRGMPIELVMTGILYMVLSWI